MNFTDIKNTVITIIQKIGNLLQFFKDESLYYSMGRLVTFLVIVTLCFDAVWSLVVLKVAWDFTVNKLLFGAIAVGGKVGEKLIEKMTDYLIAKINGVLPDATKEDEAIK